MMIKNFFSFLRLFHDKWNPDERTKQGVWNGCQKLCVATPHISWLKTAPACLVSMTGRFPFLFPTTTAMAMTTFFCLRATGIFFFFFFFRFFLACLFFFFSQGFLSWSDSGLGQDCLSGFSTTTTTTTTTTQACFLSFQGMVF